MSLLAESPKPPILPPAERGQHDLVEQTSRPVKGRANEHSSPFLVVDILEILRRRGAISANEKHAGERFRAWFRLAQFDQLRAADLARPVVDGGGKSAEIASAAERARRQIADAIRFLGGIGTSQASCLWHVIGLDQSLRQWSEEQRRTARVLSPHDASGVLIGALEALAKMPWRGPGEKNA